MEATKELPILVLALAFLSILSPAVEASFLDNFYKDTSANYTYSDSWGEGGSFTIDSGRLNITTVWYNTASVMTSTPVKFAMGATLSLEVPAVSPNEGVLLMCSTDPCQPDGTSSYGFRFRRDEYLGQHYARMQLYPGGFDVNTPDPYPTEPATISVKRISATDFEYSIKTLSNETSLGTFTLEQMSGFTDLHIGAQAITLDHSNTFSFDNLKLEDYCGPVEHHPMDFNLDCYVNMLDFALFADHWMDRTVDMRPFSIIILPDTQVYSDNGTTLSHAFSQKEIFIQMTTWIVENIEDLNIKFVLHMGDVVQCGDDYLGDCDGNSLPQWDNANEALSILDGNVPYSLIVGNHDMDPNESRDTTNFNIYFPYTRYENEPWYGGRMEDTNDDGFDPNDDYDNAYHYFQAAGMDFLVVTLEVGPTDKMLDWASSVISGHPNHRVILTTHSYMRINNTRDSECHWLPGVNYGEHSGGCSQGDPNNFSNTGQDVWQELVEHHENIDFVFSGHRNPLEAPILEGWRLDDDGSHGVHQFLCGEWYDGWLRILTFAPQEDKVYVKTYSPWDPADPNDQYISYPFPLPGYNTDPNHQYELNYEMD